MEYKLKFEYCKLLNQIPHKSFILVLIVKFYNQYHQGVS